MGHILSYWWGYDRKKYGSANGFEPGCSTNEHLEEVIVDRDDGYKVCVRSFGENGCRWMVKQHLMPVR